MFKCGDYTIINVLQYYWCFLLCEERFNPLWKNIFVSDWSHHGQLYSYSSEMNVAVLVWLTLTKHIDKDVNMMVHRLAEKQLIYISSLKVPKNAPPPPKGSYILLNIFYVNLG